MHESLSSLSGKRKYLGVCLLVTFFVFVIGMAFGIGGNDDFAMARKEILLRKIGHQLLLQSGDITSRVLPVKKIAENEYQIRFEHELTFQADSMMNTTRRLLAGDPITGDYVVEVLNCSDSSVAFGYAMSSNKNNNIVACSKRVQPKGCYIIDIRFKPMGMSRAEKSYLLGGLPLLAFAGFVFFWGVKSRKALPSKAATTFTLGSLLFEVQARQLISNKERIDLTGTETRLLRIFAMSPNETIPRERLQKEIWEDEGVIVGRSLDMFISKLRKKLQVDPNISIVVSRGKGYKLEVIA